MRLLSAADVLCALYGRVGASPDRQPTGEARSAPSMSTSPDVPVDMTVARGVDATRHLPAEVDEQSPDAPETSSGDNTPTELPCTTSTLVPASELASSAPARTASVTALPVHGPAGRADAPTRGMRAGASGTGGSYRRSKRSSSMTLTHAATKSRTNASFASSAE